MLEEAVTASGGAVHCLSSGAGHDAGVMAAVAPMAMLFIRSPGGVSHSPEESVLDEDVAAALDVVVRYLALLAERDAGGVERLRQRCPREPREWNCSARRRSRLRRSHAVFTPESFVRSDLPGWERSQGVILISPRIGAKFVQYLALMETGGRAGQPPAGVERVLYVVDGRVSLGCPGAAECVLDPGGFAYCPPELQSRLRL